MKIKNRFDIRVKQVAMVNFRQFEELTVHFDRQLTILIGKNRAGKTTVLDAVAGLLKDMVSRILNQKPEKSDLLTDNDIRNDTFEAVNTLLVGFSKVSGDETGEEQETDLSWYVSVRKGGHEPEIEEITETSAWNELNNLSRAIFKQIQRNEPASLPVLAYYRCDYGAHLSYANKNGADAAVSFDISSGYDKAFEPQSFDFRQFFEWFKWRERIAIQTGGDALKSCVEQAVLSVLSDFPGEYVNLRTDYLRRPSGDLKVTWGKEELIVNQFSSGEKLIFALTANLAWRLALLNRDVENPLEGNGVVLIDELDLHLHPTWERAIVPKLLKTFPNIQFVITTHSPLVISQVPSRHILVLDDGEVYGASDTLGQDVSTILTRVMDAPSHAHEKELGAIFKLLALNRIEEAEKLIAEVEVNVEGDLPELLEAKAIIARKQMLAGK